MTEKEKHPEVFRIHLPTSLKQGLDMTTQVRIALAGREEYQSALILEGKQFFDAGVRRVYDALCLLTSYGKDLDRAEIENIKRGIEEYLTPRER